MYKEFSKIYDELMYDCDYDKWSQYFISFIKNSQIAKENNNGKNLVGYDLACGSGNMTIRLKKAGLNVTGFDISSDMLEVAATKSRENLLDISYICQDVSKLEAGSKSLDFVTMAIDGANYLSKTKLTKVFAKVFESLKNDGVFVFDFSTIYKLKSFIGNNNFFDDGEEISYFWSSAKKSTYVQLSIAFFVKQGELYKRFDEEHKLYYFEMEFLKNALLSAGFKSVNFYGEAGGIAKAKDFRNIVVAAK